MRRHLSASIEWAGKDNVYGKCLRNEFIYFAAGQIITLYGFDV